MRNMNEINELLFRLLDNNINDQEFAVLNEWLKSGAEAKSYYCQFMQDCGAMSVRMLAEVPGEDETSGEDLHDSFDDVIWEKLAHYEKTAPEIELTKEPPERELIKRLVYPPKERRKISKFQIVTLVMSAAAVLFFVLFIRFAPVKTYSTEVATLVDRMNVTWSDSKVDFRNGDRLWTNQVPIGLDKGIVKIQYDEGVDVLIEGPAKFAVERSGVFLEYGRLFSHVSESGLGFSVETPKARFIDIGTEFGVQADVNGSAELHVIKGKVQFFAGSDGNAKSGQMLSENEAIRYDADTGKTQTVPIRTEAFVRSINSASDLLWRGQKSIDLADIIGGGNGMGSGSSNRAIQWDGQKLVQARDISLSGPIPPSQSYVPVPFSPFIDGIFVPCSKGEPVQLSSDTAELNLDEFLKQDTNGLITLMVLKKDSDTAPLYWFYSKEGAAGDREKIPLLSFPRGSNGQSAFVTTADDRGADTCIVNDARNSRANRGFGAASFLPCRYIKDERLRIIYLKFDVSQVDDLSGAVLNLCLDSGNRKRALDVYGLKDGPADFWNEESLDYSTAPGVKPAPLGNYEFDETLCDRLGAIRAIDNRPFLSSVIVSSNDSFKWTPSESVDQTAYPITNADSFRDPLSQTRVVPLRLGNERCGTRENPSILMHANAGITFDLEALRNVYGPLKSFTASCGLSPAAVPAADTDSPSASFYILLDGQEVFSAVDLTPKDDPRAIDLNLAGHTRYLTLITTQGTDGSIDNDVCLFVKPRINTVKGDWTQ